MGRWGRLKPSIWAALVGVAGIYAAGLLDKFFQDWGLYPSINSEAAKATLNFFGDLLASPIFHVISVGAFAFGAGILVGKRTMSRPDAVDSRKVGEVAYRLGCSLAGRAVLGRSLADIWEDAAPSALSSLISMQKAGLPTLPEVGSLDRERAAGYGTQYLRIAGKLLMDGHRDDAIIAAEEIARDMEAEKENPARAAGRNALPGTPPQRI